MTGKCAPALVLAAVLAAAGRPAVQGRPADPGRPAVPGHPAVPGRPAVPWEKNHLGIGQALYRENCVVCHDIDRPQSRKFGPSFYQLFQRPQMPIAKMKPSREYIKVRVKFGGTLMPAFRTWLTDRDIDTLIDYIASK